MPSNYTRPLPVPQVEYNLRGAIYDPYIRRIVWEGLLVKWKDDIKDWLSCPTGASQSSIENTVDAPFWQRVTTFVLNRTSRSSPGDETDDEELCPYFWAQPIHEFNCAFIWPPALDEPPYAQKSSSNDDDHVHGKNLTPEDELSMVTEDGEFVGLADAAAVGGGYLELDTPEYAGKIMDQWIVEKLLAQGGIRLAATLNSLFADGDSRGHATAPFLVQT